MSECDECRVKDERIEALEERLHVLEIVVREGLKARSGEPPSTGVWKTILWPSEREKP